MLERLYLIGGVALLAFYAVATLAGWEFGKAVRVTQVPPRGAAIATSGGGWGPGRSGHYRPYSSSPYWSRPGVGGGGSGGK